MENATETAHRNCSVVIVLMSPAALDSEWVREEIRLAVDLGKPLVPLLLMGAVFPELRALQYESVSDGRMPSDAFVARLPRPATDTKRQTRTRVRYLFGTMPNAADCFQHRRVVDQVCAVQAGDGAPITTQVLTGSGGVGKTQVAAAVARRLVEQGSLDLLLWVTASSRDAVLATFAQAGREVCGAGSSDPVAAGQAFTQWLASTTAQWLVVLDDVARPADLAGLWPPASASGRVVVTTRRRDAALATHGDFISVGLFSSAEAQAYLADKFDGHPGRLAEADELAADLGYLPLALSQAAAFISDQDLSCAGYRRRFSDSANLLSVLPEENALPDDYNLPVSATLMLSLEAADQARPTGLARPLLALLSLLDPHGIPYELIKAPPIVSHVTQHHTPAEDGQTETRMVNDAIAVLRRFNLVSVMEGTGRGHEGEANGRLIFVHALVQRATRESTVAGLDAAASAAAQALIEVWPQVEPDPRRAEALRANATALRLCAEDSMWLTDNRQVLFLIETGLGESGLVSAALAYTRGLLADALVRLGPDDSDTLQLRYHMVRWLGLSGDPAGANVAAEELFADAQRVLGPDHPDTLSTRSAIAYWKGDAGDPAGAVVILEALLADRSRLLGADHVDILTTRHNLARLRAEAGDMAGAANEFEQMLPQYVRMLGADHPDTLSVRNEIAFWRGETGDPAAAAVAFEDLLVDRLRVLGPDHPDTRTTRSNIAYMRGSAGDPVGAVAALEQLLADELRILGPDHPDTLTTRLNIAHSRGVTGDHTGTLRELSSLLADRMRVLGPDHPDTLTTRFELAHWRGMQGDPGGAVLAFDELLVDRLRVLGPDHPSTLLTRRAIARFRGEAGDIAGAAASLRQLLTDQLIALGPTHPSTLGIRRDLARWQGQAGDVTGAVAVLEQLLAEQVELHGPNHPGIALTRGELTRLYELGPEVVAPHGSGPPNQRWWRLWRKHQ